MLLVSVFSEWNEWSLMTACDVTCDKGDVVYRRDCVEIVDPSNPEPCTTVPPCPGLDRKTEECDLGCCPGKNLLTKCIENLKDLQP